MSRTTLPRRVAVLGLVLVTLVCCVAAWSGALAVRAAESPSGGAGVTDRVTYGFSWADGLALGVVEGITEYLPISSTGHLVVVGRLLDLDPPEGPERDALNSYIVVIQVGAILAVLVLYRRRVGQIADGIGGHNPVGRRILLALLISFIPVGVAAKTFESKIEDLLTPGPVAFAWVAGGVVLLALAGWLSRKGARGRPLDEITLQQAAIIGAFQVLSLWPGVSRSLVTIIGGVAVGLTILAAVEFSFLLGLTTLSIATAYQILTDGGDIVGQFGIVAPLVGIIAAFLAAAAAVKLFVEYLNRSELRVFGVYRIAIGVVTFALIATSVI